MQYLEHYVCSGIELYTTEVDFQIYKMGPLTYYMADDFFIPNPSLDSTKTDEVIVAYYHYERLHSSVLSSQIAANDLSIDSSANYNLVSVFVNNCVRQI